MFQWAGATIDGTHGSLTNTGTMTLTGNGETLYGGTLINDGTIDSAAGLRLYASTLNNQASGTYNFQNDSGITDGIGNGAPGSFANAGTLEKTGGTGTSSIGCSVFNSTSTALVVQSGNVTLAPASGTIAGCEFNVSTGASLSLNGGSSFTYTGTFTGTGQGTVSLSGSNLVIGSGGATFDFPGTMFQWADTGIDTRHGSLTNTGTMTLTGNGETLFFGTLINDGTIDQNSATGLRLFGSTLNNQALGTFNFQNDAGITDGGTNNAPGSIANAGTFEKTGGTGTSSIGCPVFNSSAGAVFNIAQGDTLELTAGGPVTYTGPLAGTGQGTVKLDGGTLAIGKGGVAFNFPGAMFQWTGGSIDSTLGDLTNRGTINLTGPASKSFHNDGTLDNLGTIVQTGSGNLSLHSDGQFPTTLKIEPGGSYLIESDSGVDNFAGGQTAIENAGTIKKTAGTGDSTVLASGTFSNTGVIEADSGMLSLSGTIAQVSASTLTAGTWNALGGSTLAFPSGTNITTNQASLAIDGQGASIAGIQSLATSTGSLALTGGASFATGGDFNSAGSLSLGAGSTLTVHGNYTQGSAAMLDVQLGGAPPTGLFGKLAISGSAAVAGTLQADIESGYAPTALGSFQIMTFASTSGSFTATQLPLFHGGNLLKVETNPTNLTIAAATTVADLDATGVSASTRSVDTGQNLDVSYSVSNQGNATGTTSWTDSVFLSPTGVLGSSAVLLGRVTHTGALGPSSSYAGSLTAAVPPVLPGDYFVVVETDSQGLVADANRANNTLAGANPIVVTVPSIALGGMATGTIASAFDALYQINLPAGQDVKLVASAGVSGSVELFERYQQIPAAGAYDQLAFNPAQSTQTMTLSNTQAGTYYVLLQGSSLSGAGTSYSLSAQNLPFGVSSFTPSQGGNTGSVTVTLSGAQFTPSTTASLIAPSGTAIAAAQVFYQDPNTIAATFNLSGAAPGQYNVQVSDGGLTAAASSTFAVAALAPGTLEIHIDAPAAVRPGRIASIAVDYTNTGATDAPAPLLELQVDQGQLRLAGQASFTGSSVQFLGISSTGPAGVLPPGATGQVTFDFLAGTTGQTAHFTVQQANPAGVINWSLLENQLQPSVVPPGAWSAICNNFLGAVGGTLGQYQQVLDDNATYLGQLGERTASVSRLLRFLLEQAGDFGAIARRYAPGAFGLGFADPTINQAVADAAGNVTINLGGAVRVFTLQPDGSFQGEPGDTGTLTKNGAGYQLREASGAESVFGSNGKLVSMTDTNGNTLTAGYDGSGRLSSLTDSFGNTTTYSYNAQGLISQVTDAVGRISTFTYDTGNHLLSITTPDGTESFTYITGSSAQQDNALASITYPDGTHTYFVYDALGRLILQYADGGANRIGYLYTGPGEITTSDADGRSTSAFLDDSEQTARAEGGAGQVTQIGFDSSHRPLQESIPDGLSLAVGRDAVGNPIQATNPLGQTVNLGYSSTFDTLTSLTDAAGNTTGFGYDAGGNLTSITAADGSVQTFSYNAQGDLTQSQNARSQATQYTYNSNHLLIHEDFADGTHADFTYDAHRNLASVTDSTGTTTFQYDSADRLIQVTYPGGEYLKYTYDAAGRRTSLVDQSGFTVISNYDSLGRLSTLTDGAGNLITRYTYDDSGLLIRADQGNGTYTTYQYDADRRTAEIINYAPDNTVLSSFAYTYDALSRPVTLTTLQGTTSYGYDALGQLISLALPGGRTITYQYDAAGNRVSITDSGTTTAYASNSMNEYTSAGGTTYRYDADGNLTSQTDSTGTTIFGYDDLGRLISVTTPTDTFTYQYNALGQRVAMTHDGQTTDFLIDPTGLGTVVGEFDGSGNVMAHDVYGLGLTSRVDATGASAYYGFDGAGNTAELTGAGGAVLSSYSYLPFGEALSTTGTTANPFTFGGQFGVTSEGDGLAFMRARSYDPATGRFSSPDPLGFSGGDTNLYRYVFNGPVLASDPSGLAASGSGDGSSLLYGMQTWSGGSTDTALNDAEWAMKTWSGNSRDVAASDTGWAMKSWGSGGKDVASSDAEWAMRGWTGNGRDVASSDTDVAWKHWICCDVWGTLGFSDSEVAWWTWKDATDHIGFNDTPIVVAANLLPDTTLDFGVPDPEQEPLDYPFVNGLTLDDPEVDAPLGTGDCCDSSGTITVVSSIPPAADPGGPGSVTGSAAGLGLGQTRLPNGVIQTITGSQLLVNAFPSGADATYQNGWLTIFTAPYQGDDAITLAYTPQGVLSSLTFQDTDPVGSSGYPHTETARAYLPDGQYEIYKTDGTHIIVAPDNSITTIDLSGNRTVVPGGGNITYESWPGGGTAEVLPNGTAIVQTGPSLGLIVFPDGAQLDMSSAAPPSFRPADQDAGFYQLTSSHGTIIDGVKFTPSFQYVWDWDPAGSYQTYYNGYVFGSLPDGEVDLGSPGVVEAVTPDVNWAPTDTVHLHLGAISVAPPFDSTTTVTPDGVVTVVNAQGTTVLQPNGTGETTNPNGAGKPCTAVAGADVAVALAHDPNEITGPAGFGIAGFIAKDQLLPYRIDFTNVGTATAPAQVVTVTQQLDSHLDWNTFQLGTIGFGSTTISVPAGVSSYSTRVDATASRGVFVDITAGLNLLTGVVTWTFTSIDPATLDVPANPYAGFLPPDNTPPVGEGFVSYTIKPKVADTSGTVIPAQATVVFDANLPINTRSISNTIDTSLPTSSVNPLPATITSASFAVSWSGSDGAGSGIGSYNVYVSDDGGAFQPFETNTTATSATFTGQVGHTYAFYSVAKSNLGFVQPSPATAQATTEVVNAPPPPVIVTSVHWGTLHVKTGSGKKAKTRSETVLEIAFSGPVSGASNLSAYQLSSVTSKKVNKKPVTTLKPIRLSSVVPASSSRTTSVALVPAGKFKIGPSEQLTIIASDISDTGGAALDGNHDGQPGGNFIGTFGRNGLTFAVPGAVMRPMRTSTIAARAALQSVRIFLRRDRTDRGVSLSPRSLSPRAGS
jgi:RHS repeat-associated protein